MTETLEGAVAALSLQPPDTQDRIAAELLAHVEKLERLRADIDQGLEALNEGRAKSLDIEALIRRARTSDGSA